MNKPFQSAEAPVIRQIDGFTWINKSFHDELVNHQATEIKKLKEKLNQRNRSLKKIKGKIKNESSKSL